MKKSIVKVALKNTLIYIILLILLSLSISYLTIQVSLHVKYAIDGILFNDYNNLPTYINLIIKHKYTYDLLIIASIIAFIYLIQKLLNYIRNRLTTKFKLKININLKQELFRHMLNLEYESYNSYDKEEIIQRINEDAGVYSKFFNNQFNVILDVIFLTAFIMKASVGLNWQISIYILLTIAIMLLFSLWYYKKLGIRIDNMVFKRKKLLKATIRNISNFKFIRMFNKQKDEKEAYKELNDDYCNERIKFIKLVLAYDIILEHLAYFRSPIIFTIGGIAIIHRESDNGSFNCITHFCRKNI